MDKSQSAPAGPQTRQERENTGPLVAIGTVLVAVVVFGLAAAYGSSDRSTTGVSWSPQQASLGNEEPVHNASVSPSHDPNEPHRLQTGSITANSANTAIGSGTATFLLGPRHFGVVSVPEFVGASGGDLPAIDSSPLVLGARQLNGVAFIPEYVGASGGDLPAVESSPLVIGPRHADGVAFVPVYVGHSSGVFPENTR